MPKQVRNDNRTTTPLAKASTPPREGNCSPPVEGQGWYINTGIYPRDNPCPVKLVSKSSYCFIIFSNIFTIFVKYLMNIYKNKN
ncbi:MAG: hypothetical protein FWG85_06195 [Bacteroidetes bacterium]|nr:hypothetical protein [Bacteroidota bacterium]